MIYREVVLRLVLLGGSFLLTDCHASEREARKSEDILRQDFEGSAYWPDGGLENYVEFCGGDWCQEVRYGEAASRTAAWDAAFLMFYFFDANEEFKGRRKEHALFLLKKHGKSCSGQGVGLAACALRNLQRAHGFVYHRVQYDIGYKCTSSFVTYPPYFEGRGKCEKGAPERMDGNGPE